MADDKSKKFPQDAARVDLDDPDEVRYRCEQWDCTEDELREAVLAVGVMADRVEAYLAKQNSERRWDRAGLRGAFEDAVAKIPRPK